MLSPASAIERPPTSLWPSYSVTAGPPARGARRTIPPPQSFQYTYASSSAIADGSGWWSAITTGSGNTGVGGEPDPLAAPGPGLQPAAMIAIAASRHIARC